MPTAKSHAVGLRLLDSPALATSIGIQPSEQRANARPRQGNRAVSGSIVKINGVAIGVHRISARKYNIIDVAVALVLGLWPKDPRIPSQQTLGWILKVEQGQSQSIQTARRRMPYSVVEDEPSSGSLDGRR